jgi:hypothetical protein
MLTKDQCALLKAQVATKLKQEEYRLSLAKAIVEDVVTMQSAFNQFSLTIYKQHKE